MIFDARTDYIIKQDRTLLGNKFSWRAGGSNILNFFTKFALRFRFMEAQKAFAFNIIGILRTLLSIYTLHFPQFIILL